MKNFPLEKYRYYQNGNRIIAVSSYAGKTVRGVAICHPSDEFSVETGKKLAAARCNQKIADKRYNRAVNEYVKACETRDAALRKVDKMKSYMDDSYEAKMAAAREVNSLTTD